MTALTLDAANRLTKLLGLLGSDHDGERANAAALADRLVRAHGLTWTDVLRPAPSSSTPIADWRAMAASCQVHADRLGPRDFEFICSIIKRRGDLTEKQRAWLEDIHDRIHGGRQ